MVNGIFPERVISRIPGEEVVALGAAKEAYQMASRRQNSNISESAVTASSTLTTSGLAHPIALYFGPEDQKVH